MPDPVPGSHPALDAERDRERRSQHRAYAILIGAAVIGLIALILFGHQG